MILEQSLLLIIGFLLASGLFYLLLFFGFLRRWGLFFLSVFCFAQASKAFFRPDVGLAIQQLGISVQQAAIGKELSYAIGAIGLLAFLIYYFDVMNKKVWMLGCIIGNLVFWFCSWPSLPFVLCTGLLIIAYHFRKMPRESSWIALGLVLFGLLTFAEQRLTNGIMYFLGTIAFVVATSILVGYQLRENVRQQQQTLLRSIRLENQLLKRSLQPHFLLNSLMSLQEWIETAPKEAAVFVQSLADEFRTLCGMTGKRLVPIHEELAMCRAHLSIMGFRRQAVFRLYDQGLSGNEQVPPAIFHTLIENGLTHGFIKQKEGSFYLGKTCMDDGTTIYVLRNDGSSDGPTTMEGTGLRYVKAQLESSFPGRWELHYGPVDQKGWCVEIRIHK